MPESTRLHLMTESPKLEMTQELELQYFGAQELLTHYGVPICVDIN